MDHNVGVQFIAPKKDRKCTHPEPYLPPQGAMNCAPTLLSLTPTLVEPAVLLAKERKQSCNFIPHTVINTCSHSYHSYSPSSSQPVAVPAVATAQHQPPQLATAATPLPLLQPARRSRYT